MKIHGLALSATALVLASLTTTTLFSAPANAYQCSNQRFEATGYAGTKRAALSNSRKFWSDKVRSQMGQAWTVWNIAKIDQHGATNEILDTIK